MAGTTVTGTRDESLVKNKLRQHDFVVASVNALWDIRALHKAVDLQIFEVTDILLSSPMNHCKEFNTIKALIELMGKRIEEWEDAQDLADNVTPLKQEA